MTADQRFIWQTTTAATPIDAVPLEGALAHITVTYRCNTRVLWWYEAGPARKATATFWVAGAGIQPDYTLEP